MSNSDLGSVGKNVDPIIAELSSEDDRACFYANELTVSLTLQTTCLKAFCLLLTFATRWVTNRLSVCCRSDMWRHVNVSEPELTVRLSCSGGNHPGHPLPWLLHCQVWCGNEKTTNSAACGDLLLIPLSFLRFDKFLKPSCHVHSSSEHFGCCNHTVLNLQLRVP